MILAQEIRHVAANPGQARRGAPVLPERLRIFETRERSRARAPRLPPPGCGSTSMVQPAWPTKDRAKPRSGANSSGLPEERVTASPA